MPEIEITDEMVRAYDTARWDHCDQQGGDDCCTLAGLAAALNVMASTIRAQALTEAYWKLRQHASALRATKVYRAASERAEATGHGSDERRRLHWLEATARGVEDGARDIAEMLGYAEHEIPEPPQSPQETPAHPETPGTPRSAADGTHSGPAGCTCPMLDMSTSLDYAHGRPSLVRGIPDPACPHHGAQPAPFRPGDVITASRVNAHLDDLRATLASIHATAGESPGVVADALRPARDQINTLIAVLDPTGADR